MDGQKNGSNGGAAFSPEFLRKQVDEFAEGLSKASNRFVEMLCAAFTLKHGYAPIIAHDRGARRQWLVHPDPGDRTALVDVDAKLPEGHLGDLSRRYYQVTDIPPDDCMVELFVGEGYCEVKFARRG